MSYKYYWIALYLFLAHTPITAVSSPSRTQTKNQKERDFKKKTNQGLINGVKIAVAAGGILLCVLIIINPWPSKKPFPGWKTERDEGCIAQVKKERKNLTDIIKKISELKKKFRKIEKKVKEMEENNELILKINNKTVNSNVFKNYKNNKIKSLEADFNAFVIQESIRELVRNFEGHSDSIKKRSTVQKIMIESRTERKKLKEKYSLINEVINEIMDDLSLFNKI